MDYGVVKSIHQAAVALSFAGFFARGVGMIGNAGWIRGRPARTLPHVVDTILLVSAVGLVYLLDVNPFVVPWLAAKIVGLLVYIVLGGVALRYGPSKPIRVTAWIAALAVFGYIVSVAITKSAAGFLAIVR